MISLDSNSLNTLRKLMEAGKLAVIDRSYSLEEMVEAHTYVEKVTKKGTRRDHLMLVTAGNSITTKLLENRKLQVQEKLGGRDDRIGCTLILLAVHRAPATGTDARGQRAP
jgi:hypothetical protein